MMMESPPYINFSFVLNSMGYSRMRPPQVIGMQGFGGTQYNQWLLMPTNEILGTEVGL